MADLIGVFGGTFDPPHLAHLILAEEARTQLGLRRVLWVVTGDPPHKPNQALSSIDKRLAMVNLAIEDNPNFQLSRADIDRPPPHYSHGTLAWLAERHPASSLVFIMGGDSLKDLPAWNKPADFISLADQIAVMQRPNIEADFEAYFQQFPSLESKVTILDVPLIDISGVDIRDRVRNKRGFRYLTTPSVCDYIEHHRLYR